MFCCCESIQKRLETAKFEAPFYYGCTFAKVLKRSESANFEALFIMVVLSKVLNCSEARELMHFFSTTVLNTLIICFFQ